MWKGETRQVMASREVIVSAGAINSPKLLMLSGIGPREHLQALKVMTTKNYVHSSALTYTTCIRINTMYIKTFIIHYNFPQQ